MSIAAVDALPPRAYGAAGIGVENSVEPTDFAALRKAVAELPFEGMREETQPYHPLISLPQPGGYQ